MGVRLYSVAFDCADAGKLAGFWADVLGRDVDDRATSQFATIGVQGGAASPGSQWMFLQVPEAKAAKNRCHPDFLTADLEAEVARLADLGAAKLAEHEEAGVRWVTLTDPDGNEFDVIAGGE
jgi:catechol 2,3-dioxygenase-like lactoylglutathione lyase family enzyme